MDNLDKCLLTQDITSHNDTRRFDLLDMTDDAASHFENTEAAGCFDNLFILFLFNMCKPESQTLTGWNINKYLKRAAGLRAFVTKSPDRRRNESRM